MELESELRSLAAEIEWPRTPALRPELAPRRRPMWRGRPLALAVTVVTLALAALFAARPPRGAVLRLLGPARGPAAGEFGGRLPPAQEQPLSARLGPAISIAAARDLLGRPPLQPP